jgi:hypothetical protein
MNRTVYAAVQQRLAKGRLIFSSQLLWALVIVSLVKVSAECWILMRQKYNSKSEMDLSENSQMATGDQEAGKWEQQRHSQAEMFRQMWIDQRQYCPLVAMV